MCRRFPWEISLGYTPCKISEFYFYSLILFKSMRYHQCHQKVSWPQDEIEFTSRSILWSEELNDFHCEIKYCYHIITTLYYTIKLNLTTLSDLIVYIIEAHNDNISISFPTWIIQCVCLLVTSVLDWEENDLAINDAAAFQTKYADNTKYIPLYVLI